MIVTLRIDVVTAKEGNGAGGSKRYFHDLSEIPCQPSREGEKNNYFLSKCLPGGK